MPARLSLVRGDLTEQDVDAIVNAANSSLLGGGGVDGAIHRRGGPAILEECRAIIARIGRCKPGEAVVTTGGRLPARRVVHTVGPVWNGGSSGEDAVLTRAWTRSLEVAVADGARTVAFPAISTGAYGFPMALAARVSLAAVVRFMAMNPTALDEVRVVLFAEADLQVWQAEHRALHGH
jgi:O-acetyl-ADP-ribose deacetylase (regulator of RNase III)